MKRLIAILAALSLSACQLPDIRIGDGGLPSVSSPAPLANTAIDDTALMTAWKSFDIALDAINLLIDAKMIVIGSPKAVKVADGIDRVTQFLTAAESAAAAGSTKDYGVALANAKGAITELRAALKGS
jgi:hypothetical protein